MSFDCVWLSNEHQHNPTVQTFVASRIEGEPRNFSPCLCLAVIKDEKMVAGVVLHNWQKKHGVIEVTGASDDKRWLTRKVLWQIYNMIFNDIGCQMAVHRNADGADINRMCRSYGFTETRLPRMRGRNSDEILMTLTDDAWRMNGFHKENKNGR